MCIQGGGVGWGGGGGGGGGGWLSLYLLVTLKIIENPVCML